MEILLQERSADSLRYSVSSDDPSRRPIYVSTKSEDRELQPRERQALISDARDQLRVFPLAGFLLRKHLQSVAFYRFRAATPNREFNDRLTRRIKRWSRRTQCDAAGRQSLDELLYLMELHRAVDGDVGILLLRNNKIQLIEGDRIRSDNFPADGAGSPLPFIAENVPETPESGNRWVHGVKINRFGAALAYAVSRRNEFGGFVHEKVISAAHMKLLGYLTRKDQIRGISLHAPAANMFAKLGESVDLAVSKMKLDVSLGMATFREKSTILASAQKQEEDQAAYDAQADKARESFGPGLTMFDLATGEDIRMIESQHPSQNFQSFCENVLRMLFASYDIPYSFFDGSKTNYYGSEGEFEQYIDSVERKQKPTIEILNEMTFDWLVRNWILDPVDPLELPNGWTMEDLYDDCGWSGAGLPSWRMFRRVKEMSIAVGAGFISPSEMVSEYGYDFKKNLDDLAELIDYAQGKGIALPFGREQKTNLGL